MYFDVIPPAAILKLIRDLESPTFETISLEIRKLYPLVFESGFHQMIYHGIQQLNAAGLITIDKETQVLQVTDMVDRLTSALNLSLTILATWTPHSQVVNPLFGQPNSEPQLCRDVFVLMPFSPELQPVYEDHIKPVCDELNLTVARADDLFGADSIISEIWASICSCSILIADCTARNPNVFYEIGISDTVGRPTILITQSIDDVPFDLRHMRCIVYEYTPRGMSKFNESLRNSVIREMRRMRFRNYPPNKPGE
jgi:hypothetical protein